MKKYMSANVHILYKLPTFMNIKINKTGVFLI